MKGDKTVNITIKGGGVTLNIPVIPSKVNVSDGSSTPKTVTIWRKGEVDFNDGKSLDGLSWSSFFPSRYDASYCNDKNLKKVQWYINAINKWKNAGTVVQVIIPAMNINRSMKVKTFQGDYEGQELDYYYDLEFKEYVKLPQVKVQAKKYITVKKRARNQYLNLRLPKTRKRPRSRKATRYSLRADRFIFLRTLPDQL